MPIKNKNSIRRTSSSPKNMHSLLLQWIHFVLSVLRNCHLKTWKKLSLMNQTSKVQFSGKLMNGSVKERVLPNLAYLIQAMKERKKSIFYTTALFLETFNDYVDTILSFSGHLPTSSTAWWAENYSKIKVAQYPFKNHSYTVRIYR